MYEEINQVYGLVEKTIRAFKELVEIRTPEKIDEENTTKDFKESLRLWLIFKEEIVDYPNGFQTFLEIYDRKLSVEGYEGPFDYNRLEDDLQIIREVIGLSEEQHILLDELRRYLDYPETKLYCDWDKKDLIKDVETWGKPEYGLQNGLDNLKRQRLDIALNELDEVVGLTAEQKAVKYELTIYFQKKPDGQPNEVWFYKDEEGQVNYQGEYEPSIGESLSHYENHEDERLWEHLLNDLQGQGLYGMEIKEEAYVLYGPQSDLEIKEMVGDALDSTAHAEGHGRHMADALREAMDEREATPTKELVEISRDVDLKKLGFDKCLGKYHEGYRNWLFENEQTGEMIVIHDSGNGHCYFVKELWEDEAKVERLVDEFGEGSREFFEEKHFEEQHEKADWIHEQTMFCSCCERVMDKIEHYRGRNRQWVCPDCGMIVELLLPIKGVE